MQRRELLKIAVSLTAVPVAKSAEWTPSFFNTHQNETVIHFTDIVIPTTDTPGAKEALVNRYLDKLLAASDQDWQAEFVRDLDTLDRFSRQTAGGDFVRLTVEQQGPVLEKMFLSVERPSFDRLKAWTARVYYATKIGFDELNKGGAVPGSVGCE